MKSTRREERLKVEQHHNSAINQKKPFQFASRYTFLNKVRRCQQQIGKIREPAIDQERLSLLAELCHCWLGNLYTSPFASDLAARNFWRERERERV
jgi:hypothetical protein